MVLVIDSHPYRYEAEALCRMFLRGRELKIFEGADIPEDDFIYTGVFGDEISVRIKMDGKDLSAKAEETGKPAAAMELPDAGISRQFNKIHLAGLINKKQQADSACCFCFMVQR